MTDQYRIFESKQHKFLRSPFYNYDFNKIDGSFRRWGASEDDDPQYAPSPEILDLEISTICSGINGKVCDFCYKFNNCNGKNMSFDTFVNIFHKLPRVLCQTALGVGDIGANPDLEKILIYCRQNDYQEIIPNITINGWNLTDYYADMLATLTGATAVSRYNPKDVCYNAIKKLTDRGLKQVNIHQLLCKELLNECYQTIEDYKNDKRLNGLNAIIFLLIKPKYRKGEFNIPTRIQFKELIETCLNESIPIGFDSCAAQWFELVVKQMDIPKEKKIRLLTISESCESSLMSSYINVSGDFFPCSFTEGIREWETGLSVVNCKDFVKDIWFNEKLTNWRDNLLGKFCKNGCRNCPTFPSINVR